MNECELDFNHETFCKYAYVNLTPKCIPGDNPVSMKLAILGTDSDILQLAAAATSEGHKIVWLGDIRSEDAATIAASAPGLPDRGSEWELLLDRTIADAVLIGRGTVSNDARAEQVKRLATKST
jgi:hypothetical protein